MNINDLKRIEGFQVDKKDVVLKFCLEEKINEGYSGYIWLVEDISTKKQYALKTKKRGNLEDLERESNFGKMLPRNMFVGSIGDNFERAKIDSSIEPGFLMDFAKEGSLETKISDLSYEQAIKYGVDLLVAVKYLQDNDLVHKDLFANNVLIYNGIAKISDFGGSVEFSPEINHSCTTGKVYYPPEVQYGDWHPFIDTWSVAVLIYKMLYKRDIVPLINDGSNQMAPHYGKKDFAPIIFNSIPNFPNLDIILRKSLKINMEDRLSTLVFLNLLKSFLC